MPLGHRCAKSAAGPEDIMIGNMRAFALGAAALAIVAGLAVPAEALDSTPQAAIVTPLASTRETAAGQPIVLPQRDARVIASHFEIPPGATLPVHQHPFPRYAYVLAGELTVTNVETGQSTTYKAGDFIVEMVGVWHQGASIGTEPVQLIVIDQVEGDAAHTVLKP